MDVVFYAKKGFDMTRRSRAARLLSTAVAILPVAAMAGCAADSAEEQSGTIDQEITAEADLREVCPSTVVVQALWEPEIDHASFYQLMGDGYTIDTERKLVKGPLVTDGKPTGVDIEVRAGGSAIGFQSINTQMYLDRDILLGSVPFETMIKGAEESPVTAVFATRQTNPVSIQWDPAEHPDWESIEDIGRSDATVVVASYSDYVDALISQGVLKENQVDRSYDGTAARFVADPSIAQEGFVTAEVQMFETGSINGWDRPLKWALVADSGYDVYPDALTVRTGDLEKNSDCLSKLVPMLQQASLEYIEDPSWVNGLVVELAEEYRTGWSYPAAVADGAYEVTKELGLMFREGIPAGGFDDTRISENFDLVVAQMGAVGVDVPDGLTVDMLYNNEFIDPSIAP